MDPTSNNSILKQAYQDIVQLYVLGDLSLDEVKEIMAQRGPSFQLSGAQWKSGLRACGIFKNIRSADAKTMLDTLKEKGYRLDQCLVLSKGVLVDIWEVERHRKRKRTFEAASDSGHRARSFLYVPLPFALSQLRDLEIFKSFQRLLWFTSVHFDSCFDRGIWTKDERGVYCRSEALISGLSALSRLHNMLCDALKQLGGGQEGKFWSEVRTASVLHRTVVQTFHHRQFPDLLAIASLFEKNNMFDARRSIAKDLYAWAKMDLQQNDPRREMFKELIQLPVDRKGHMYLAYDACCRELWSERAGRDDYIKAYYAYNQASLPRAEPGQFFDLYQNKTIDEIDFILQQVNQKFAPFDHARICLWHTAIRYLLSQERFHDAEVICQKLRPTLILLENHEELYQNRQLNVDTSLTYFLLCALCADPSRKYVNDVSTLTYFLLGSAQSAQSNSKEALTSFQKCVSLRDAVIPNNAWDPTLVGALEELEKSANQLENPELAVGCSERLTAMYSAMMRHDLTNQLHYSSQAATREWIQQKARSNSITLQ